MSLKKYRSFIITYVVLVIVSLLFVACGKNNPEGEMEEVVVDTTYGPCCSNCVYPQNPIPTTSQYFMFDGISNYIQVVNHRSLNIDAQESFTVTCWISTNGWKNMPVFRKRDANNIGYEMTVGSNGAYAINMRSLTGVNVGSSAVSDLLMNTRGWYHLSMVLDKDNQVSKTYINGVLQGTTKHSQIGELSFVNLADVIIGHSVEQNRFFSGNMDDIRVWTKALTAEDILVDMNTRSVNSATSNLIAAWDFEKIIGNTVKDISGNGHDGRIIGSITTGNRSLVQIPGASIDSLYRPATYQSRLAQFRQESRSSKDIVFVGNSITAGVNWSELLGNPNAINRGISGDITFGVLARMDEVLRGKPAKIFVLIGINDLAVNVSDMTIINNYRRIINIVKSCSPETEIYFNTILPVNDTFTNFPTHVSRANRIPVLNDALEILAKEEKVVLIDSYSHFKDGEGKLIRTYTKDGLHLNPLGYEHWVLMLKKYMN